MFDRREDIFSGYETISYSVTFALRNEDTVIHWVADDLLTSRDFMRLEQIINIFASTYEPKRLWICITVK